MKRVIDFDETAKRKMFTVRTGVFPELDECKLYKAANTKRK